MTFQVAHKEVYNRGKAPIAFLIEITEWARLAPTELFEWNEFADIYARVKSELGPYDDVIHRKAVMLEVLRVLALFESSCDWTEGEDSSKSGPNTKENSEAGAWQQSYDCRKLSSDVQTVLLNAGITNGIQFQGKIKKDHELALLVTVMILRLDMTNYDRIPNGPLRKGTEREKTWPNRPKLWDPKESIYPWLSRASVAEFQLALTE